MHIPGTHWLHNVVANNLRYRAPKVFHKNETNAYSGEQDQRYAMDHSVLSDIGPMIHADILDPEDYSDSEDPLSGAHGYSVASINQKLDALDKPGTIDNPVSSLYEEPNTWEEPHYDGDLQEDYEIPKSSNKLN